MEYTLNIGEVAVSQIEHATYTCFGLGSCIGLFLQDRLTGITGGAHIMLPDAINTTLDDGKFYTAESAVRELLHRFKVMGSDLTCLRAKIAGGANVLKSGYEIGFQNAQSVRDHLVMNRVYVAAVDVGGVYTRTATFNSATGIMVVKVAQTNENKIY